MAGDELVRSSAARDRVFVASYGTDTSNTTCSLTQPCRTFQNAINNVAVDGEVTAIDSAGFQPMTITQSVTITSPNGVEAGIVPASGGNAITITAPSANVTLRGLTLEGAGVGATGINTGTSLTIENCVIRDVTGDGIDFFPNATSNLNPQTRALPNSQPPTA